MPRMTSAELELYQLRHKPAVKQSLTTAAVEYELGREIETLHKPFIELLDRFPILYTHARPDVASTVQTGQFDFGCFYFSAAAFVEFKAHPEPEKHLSAHQKIWQAWAKQAHIPTLVTNSVQCAWHFIKVELELKL